MQTDPAAASQPATTQCDDPAETTPVEQLAEPAPAGRPPAFHFEELTLDAGFDANWDRRQTNSPARDGARNRYDQTDDVRHFEESIGLHATGDVLGERFLRYQFDVRGGWEQETYTESRPGRDLRDSPNGDVFEYDARATMFPAGKVTTNLFALNLHDRVPRMFLPSLDRRRERYGAEMLYNDQVLPMRLSFEDEYEALTSYSRSLDDDESRRDRRLEYEATWQPNADHQLRFQYEYDDMRERYSGQPTTFDTTRDYFTLNHSLQFGDDKRSRLETMARFQDETGDLARDVAEAVPQLRLQHTESLSSTYRAQYLQESYEGVQLNVYRGDVGLSHQLKDWLDSGINFYGLTQEADQGGDVREMGGILTSALDRENELGRFSTNVTYNHAWQRADNGGDQGVVVSESATFRDPLSVFLAHTDVNLFSILVTDAARRRIYLVGGDYSVVQVGRYTSLVRVPTGNIANGQTVLVSYLYRTSEGYELSRDRLDMRVQQTFKQGWIPYYSASLQKEEVDRTRFTTYIPRDVNRHRVGLDYRRTNWSAGGELEYNDDSIDPYQAVHIRGDAVLFDRVPQTLSGRGSFSFFRFEGEKNRYELQAHDTSLIDLGLSYRYLFSADVDLNAAAAYRYEDDTLYGITHGVDVSASLNWRIGLFTAIFEVEYDRLNLPDSDDGTFAAWIKLRRSIPVIGRRDP